MKILVSFVNTTESTQYYNKVGLSQLALLDTRKKNIYFLNLADVNDNGVSGLASDKENIYIVTQSSETSSLIKINKSNLVVAKIVKSKNIKDPHSILRYKSKLYVVSTGTNTIEEFDRDLNYLKTFWQHPNTSKQADVVHVNSVFVYKGDICISCFGRKRDELWSSADSGYVMNTKNNNKIITNINHPHSAKSSENTIYYCESSLGKVFKNKREVYSSSRSYLRGLAIRGSEIVIGVSGSRKISKSTQKLLNANESGRFISKTGIIIFNRKDKKQKYFDLTFVEKEIYDLLVLNDKDFVFNLGIVGILPVIGKRHVIENRFITDLYSTKEKLEEHNIVLERRLKELKESAFYKPFVLINKLENKFKKFIKT